MSVKELKKQIADLKEQLDVERTEEKEKLRRELVQAWYEKAELEGRLSKIRKHVKAQSKDWHHSYETLGHSYQMFLAEAIGFIEELEGLVSEEEEAKGGK